MIDTDRVRNARIVVVDDHRLFRDGVASLLNSTEGFRVVGEASGGRESLRVVEETRPDLVIMDIGLPELNGIDATRLMKQRFDEVKILCLSMHRRSQYVREAFRAGAAGYVLKDAAFDELARAIREILAGNTYISPLIGSVVVDALVAEDSARNDSLFDSLTLREREVLQLYAAGRSTKQIASDLGVSSKTVASHREKIMEKLHTDSVVDLTKRAIREGLVELG